MRFFKDTDSFEFENPSQYPASRPVELLQVKERSAGGVSHVETYAKPIARRTLNFEAMSYEDYVGLLDWYINKVNGMAEVFSFEDERGATFNVRFEDATISLVETSFRRFKGAVNLELIS